MIIEKVAYKPLRKATNLAVLITAEPFDEAMHEKMGEILNNLGCDIRILQMEGAKDPDEFIKKYDFMSKIKNYITDLDTMKVEQQNMDNI